jgi:hypothetical protein
MTAEEYEERFGCKPENDDLDRVNCTNKEEVGHWQCGVCDIHDKPRFMCGCLRVPLPK